MYLKHYQLALKPFDLSLKPGFLWLGEKHAEALATLNYGINEDLGFLLLTGDVGAGKTALIRRLTNNLDGSTIVAHITDPGLAPPDFFKILATEFGMKSVFSGKGDFLIDLKNFLHQAYADNKKVLLIIDEAQRLNDNLLDQIRVLSNIERRDRKLINIFFVGQPEFKNQLMTDKNRALRQRIAVNYHIHPLTESEIGQYVVHRLKMAGATQKIFEADAIHEIFKFTQGYPRAINIICDHALLTGYSAELKTINGAVIRECQKELSIRAGADSRIDEAPPAAASKPTTPPKPTATPAPIPHPSPPPRSTLSTWGMPVLIGICILLTGLTGYLFLWPELRSSWQPSPPANAAGDSERAPANLANDQWRLSDKIEAEQAQASSSPPAPPIAADKVATKPAADKPAEPQAKAENDGRQVSDTVEKTVTVAALRPTPPAPEMEIRTPPVRPEETTEIAGRPSPKTDITATGSQPAAAENRSAAATPDSVSGTEAAGDYDPIPDKSLRALAVMSAALAAKTENKASPTPPAVKADNQVVARTKTQTEDTAGPQVKSEASPTPPAPRESTVEKKTVVPVIVPAPASNNVAAAVVAKQATTAPVKKAPKTKTIAPKPVKKKSPQVTASKSTPKVAATRPTSQAPVKKATPKPTQPTPSTSKSAPLVVATAVVPPKIVTSVKPPAITTSAKPTTSSLPRKTTAPSRSAQAQPVRQPATQPLAGPAALEKKPDPVSLEKRLRWFLKSYCVTYSKRDLKAFRAFFVPGARENGESFESRVPKYKRNFALIEAIQYRIDLKQFAHDDNKESIKIDGNFFLKWLPPDSKWRENEGQVSMTLIENGQSFLVQRLDYQGKRSKKK